MKWSNTSTAYTGHSAGWINSTTKLTGFGGLSDVRLRWRFGSDGTGVDEGWAIDDVSITPQFANDVGPTQIDTPATVHILGLPVSPKAKVKNFGTSANTFNVQLLIHDRVNNLVYDQTQSANVAPDSFFDVFFAVQWTPADTGNHTATVITLLGTDQNRTNDTLSKSFRVTPDSRTNLTPDGGGYKYSASNSSTTPRPNYTWSNAAPPPAQNSPTAGILVPGTQTDDFLSAVLVLPTPFTFYGLACDSIRISTNGWMAFTDTATGNHTLGTSSFPTEALIPNTSAPNYFIAALWDDLDTVSSVPTAGVYFMDNVGATGEYVIEWFHFKKYLTADANDMLFQIVLNFNNNSVRITYAAAGDGGFNYNQTAQGSVGIEGNGSATLAPTSLRSMFGEIDGKAADTKSDPEILARLLQGSLNETPGSPAQVGPQGSNYYFQDDKPYSAPTQGVTIVFSDQEANLPIQLAYLSATRINTGQSVRVAWGTLSEINNFGFWVEKAQNLPVNFQTIPNSFVEGHGTTNEPQHYVFIDQNVGSGAWYYRLKQQDLDGTVHYSDPVRVELTTSVVEVAPKVFSLLQNYPNPFNPATEIKFSVENTARATLEIYNVLGQKVVTLFDDVAEAGQYYRVRLNASSFATGLYVYRLQSGTRTAVKKMLLLK
jgi:hypothetical protein